MTTVTPEGVLARTRQMLDSVPYLILATTAGMTVSARQVQPLTIDDDLTIWVGTSPRSRKVHEVRGNPRATAVIEQFDSFAYASIQCVAQIVDDVASRTEHWIDGLAPFFPAGPHGDDFVLLRLDPQQIELMDFAQEITPAPYGLVPAAIERAADGWHLRAHPRS